jgi:hypothetical protein
MVLVSLILFFFAVLGVHFFCFFVWEIFFADDVRDDIDISQAKNIAAIEKFSGIHFPQGVVWQNASKGGWIDKFILCKLYASNDDIQKMFAEKTPKWSSTERYFHNHIPTWFRPDSVENFKSTEIYNKNKKVSICVLYEDKPNKNNADLLLVYMIILHEDF